MRKRRLVMAIIGITFFGVAAEKVLDYAQGMPHGIERILAAVAGLPAGFLCLGCVWAGLRFSERRQEKS